MTTTVTTPDLACTNAIRTLAIDMIQKANSGHPGLPLGAAPMAQVLWRKIMKFDAADPSWPDRDRFVLSAGHGSSLLYALLHLSGFEVSLDDLKSFRQWGSKTPGHPEFGETAGVECTTGPLGQGVTNAVGMAVAEAYLAGRYNRSTHTVVDHRTYTLVGDGDLMEGIAYEAVSLAGKLGLGKLTVLYDSNDVTLDGPLDVSFTEGVAPRFEACGWYVIRIEDGDTDFDGIEDALRAAANDSRPTLIEVKTTIGFGSPNKAGTAASHGAPLGDDEITLTKAALGASGEAFEVAPEAMEEWRTAGARGASQNATWKATFSAWRKANPGLAAEWDAMAAGELPIGWDAELPTFEAGPGLATRESAHKVLQAIGAGLAPFLGGDADLSCSTKTAIVGAGDFSTANPTGRNIRYGVREHAMGAIANGIAYHGGLVNFTGTFFVFADYMRPAIRLAAMNNLGAIYVFTHDSVAVGEDGPTHQPVEHLASLRAIPGLTVIRPGDANETTEAWRNAVARRNGPTVLVFSRQKMATLDRAEMGPAADLARGAYVLKDAPKSLGTTAIIIASGSELGCALEAQANLVASGIGVRVVSMPCWELFAEQPQAWRDKVLPPAVSARVSIEAGSTFGWERWLGGAGKAIGIDRFGASAPGDLVLTNLGIHADAIEKGVRDLLA
jgi:transketolase